MFFSFTKFPHPTAPHQNDDDDPSLLLMLRRAHGVSENRESEERKMRETTSTRERESSRSFHRKNFAHSFLHTTLARPPPRDKKSLKNIKFHPLKNIILLPLFHIIITSTTDTHTHNPPLHVQCATLHPPFHLCYSCYCCCHAFSV